MSTVKALAEVLAEHVKEHISADDLLERLQDIIAVESAGERLATNEAGRAAERAQQAPMTATRAQVLAEVEERYTVTPEGAWQEMLNRKIAEHEQELNRLFEAHQRSELKLQLESDRRARSVAERMLALCKLEMSRLPRNDERELCMALDGINIEALVDESKI